MSQKLSVNDFEWIEMDDLSTFKENFTKNYDGNSDTGYILEVDVKCQENLHKLHRDLSFLPERRTLINVVSLFVHCTIKKTMLSI